MTLIAVESSQIVAVGYDFHTGQMAIEFRVKNGRSVYVYDNVEAQTAAAIVFAKSVGKAFAATLKADATKYPFQKQTDPSGFTVDPMHAQLAWVKQLMPYAPVGEGAF